LLAVGVVRSRSEAAAPFIREGQATTIVPSSAYELRKTKMPAHPLAAAGRSSGMSSRRAPFAIVLCLALILAPACIPSAQSQSFGIEDWEKRLNERQPPEAIMDGIDLRPGMVVGEIGAGSGRMTMWLAQRVGPEGKIYANDIDQDALDKLRRRCERDDVQNVKIILGEVKDPRLPEGALDLLFLINVYHHADDPVALLRNARASLAPGGLLAIVECDPGKTDWGKEHGCVPPDEMTRQLSGAGYELVRTESFLREDSINVFRISEP
jgi:SAM-dependent methyltransferase